MSDQPGRHPGPERGPGDALLDELLRAAAAEPQPLPPGLLDDVERFVAGRRRRRRRRMLVGAAAAAAVALLASCWLAMRTVNPTRTGLPVPGPAVIAAKAASRPAEKVTVTTGPDTIAVPVRTGHPKVTIYRLYPAVARRPIESRGLDKH